MTGAVSTGVWYHMSIAVDGCDFVVTTRPTDLSAAATTITQTVANCQSAGTPGLRSHYTTASWRDMAVSSVG